MRGKGVDAETYIKRAKDRYDAEIAHNDKSIEQVIAKLKEVGALDNTLVIFASDHGEEFWEHGFGAHGHSVYSRIDSRRSGFLESEVCCRLRAESAEPVQLIDIMPTVLELVDVKSPAGIQGQSLVPLLKGQPFSRNAPVMASKLALPEGGREAVFRRILRIRSRA